MVSLLLISLKKNIAFTLEKSVFIHKSPYFFSLQYLQWKFFSYLEFTLYCDCHQVFLEISDVHGPSSQQHSCFCTMAASMFSLCVEKLRYFSIISEKENNDYNFHSFRTSGPKDDASNFSRLWEFRKRLIFRQGRWATTDSETILCI